MNECNQAARNQSLTGRRSFRSALKARFLRQWLPSEHGRRGKSAESSSWLGITSPRESAAFSLSPSLSLFPFQSISATLHWIPIASLYSRNSFFFLPLSLIHSLRIHRRHNTPVKHFIRPHIIYLSLRHASICGELFSEWKRLSSYCPRVSWNTSLRHIQRCILSTSAR